MITPGKYDLKVYRLNDFSFTFDIQIDGVTVSLAGATAYCNVRAGEHEESTLITTITPSINASHEITLALTDTQTKALTAGDYWYDVLVVDASGNDTTYLTGRFAVRDTLTDKTI